MPKIKLVKKKTNEMSGTGGSASATPGTGAQYAAPKAFPKVASDYNKTFGTHFAPSIPNRPSKAIDYKQLYEAGFNIGDKLKHKLTGAEMVITKIDGNNLTTKITDVGTLKGGKVGQINKTNALLIGKTYDWIADDDDMIDEGELKLGVKYDYKGESGFISTGGSNDPRNWKFLSGKKPDQYPYLAVKADLVPSEKQPGKYDGAFDMGLGKGHHIDEAGNEYDSLAGILKQLGAEDDAVKVLIKAVEMGALKPSDTVTIVKKALGKKEINEVKLDIDDRIKVTYGNEFYGETGTITDIKRGFVTVEMDRDGKEYSMHLSDVQKIEDEDDDDDMIDEGHLIKEARYTEFKKMTQVRTPGEQLHRAIREIRRKIDEINRLVSYTEKMKTEMKSDVNEVRYLNRTKEALAKISARIQETNNKIKHLVQ